MSQERSHSSAARERPIIRSHSLYNPEASGPIVDEGYVAERVRAYEGIFKQHWIPIERTQPPEPVRDFLSRSSLRPFPPFQEDTCPSSSLSSTHVPIENTPRQIQVRRLSRRRMQTFTSSLSGPQTPILGSTSTLSRQAMSDEQRSRVHQYLVQTGKNDEDEGSSTVPSQKAQGIVAPYIRSPMRRRRNSRVDRPGLSIQHTDMSLQQPVILDPPSGASHQISFPAQIYPEEASISKKTWASSGARPRMHENIPRLLPRRSIAERLGDLVDKTTKVHEIMSDSRPIASVFQSKDKDDQSTPVSSHLRLGSKHPDATPASVNSDKGTPGTIVRRPKDVWPPLSKASKQTSISPRVQHPPTSTPVRSSLPRKQDQSTSQNRTFPPRGQEHEEPQRPVSSFGTNFSDRPNLDLPLRHRASTLTPFMTNSNAQPHIRTCSTIGPSTDRRGVEAKSSDESQPLYKAEAPHDIETSKISIWSLDRSSRQPDSPSLMKTPMPRPTKVRPPFEDEPLDFAKAPFSAEVAEFENAIPVFSTEPSTSLAIGGAEPSGDYFGYASRKLRRDLSMLSNKHKIDQEVKRYPSSGPVTLQWVASIEEQACTTPQEAESLHSLLDKLSPIAQSEHNKTDSDVRGMVNPPEEMSNQKDESLEAPQTRRESVTSQPRSSGSKASSAKRTISVSRMFRKVSSWKLVLVDKEKNEKKTEGAQRQVSMPASQAVSIAKEPIKNENGEPSRLERISKSSGKFAEPYEDEDKAPPTAEQPKDEPPDATQILRPWITSSSNGRGQTVQLSSEPNGFEGAVSNGSSPQEPMPACFGSSPQVAEGSMPVNPPARSQNASPPRPLIAADTRPGSTNPWVKSLRPSTSRLSCPTATNGNDVFNSSEYPLSKPSPRQSLQTMRKTPLRPSATPVGFCRVKPSGSWIKDSSRKSAEHLRYPLSCPTMCNANETDLSGGELPASAVAAAESVPKVGSLAALTYLKNHTGTARRQPRPSISVEVLPASSACFDHVDDENLSTTDQASGEGDDHGTVESPYSTSSRASMLMRRGAARGERVKKASVLISLDGPADLRIDASVRKKRLGRTILEERSPTGKGGDRRKGQGQRNGTERKEVGDSAGVGKRR